MRESDAAKVVGMLFAYFPGRDVTDDTAQLWEREVVGFEFEDACEAAQEIGATAMRLPTLAGFIDTIKLCRKRQAERMPALPPAADACTFEEFLRSNPDARERVRRLGIWRDVLERAEA